MRTTRRRARMLPWQMQNAQKGTPREAPLGLTTAQRGYASGTAGWSETCASRGEGPASVLRFVVPRAWPLARLEPVEVRLGGLWIEKLTAVRLLERAPDLLLVIWMRSVEHARGIKALGGLRARLRRHEGQTAARANPSRVARASGTVVRQ